jgi:hypothetical protein
VFAAVASVFAVMSVSATAANADPIGFEFDQGVINLGGEEEGTWAALIDPTLVPPDPPATIAADVDDEGNLEADAEDFIFAPKRIEDLETGNGALPVVDANIVITAEDDIDGEFDTATGESEVVIPADVFITVYPANQTTSVARCRVDGFDLNLATAGNMSDPGDPAETPPRPPAEYDGEFFAPPSGAGAMIATWASLPESESEGGSLAAVVCPGLDDMLGGPGGVWMSGEAGAHVVPPALMPPAKAPKLVDPPSNPDPSTSATFTFEAGDGETSPVTGFDCQLDGQAVATCDTGSVTYTNLGAGAHTFTVKARNASGTGPATTHSWTVGAAGKAELGKLSVKPSAKKVKSGKKAKFKASVTNSGSAAATGVEICVKAPKKLVSGAKCQSVGSLDAGASASAKFNLKVAKGAKSGKKAKLKFSATGDGLSAQKAKGTITVK